VRQIYTVIVQENSTMHHYLHKKEQPHSADWGYTGENGPEHWGDLCPEYEIAKTGKKQSPIDIRNPVGEHLPKLHFSYKPSRIRLIYNGHTIEEQQDPGSFTVGDGQSFELKQFHFHSPSEHTVDGKPFPMEMHLVHQAQDGTLGVLTVFITEGEHNAAFDPVWNNLPDANQPSRDADRTIDTMALLPKDHSYYAYEGSFTTPPCTEGVQWVVLTTPVSLSKQQISRFRQIIDGNNRPVQPLNGRRILQSQN
jgi:carbonic anhydrase